MWVGDIMDDKEIEDGIECPFCGKNSVMATVITTFYCTKEHPMYNDGVGIDGETFGELYGMPHKETMKYSSFRCTSCGKRFFPFQFKVETDENGICTFVEVEKKKKEKR
jgi:DNA-directed RNA polymerase subunit RPC12/RpoP